MSIAFALEPVPHAEAAAMIAGKPAVTKDVFDALPDELKARAFTILGIEQHDVLQSVRDTIAELPQGGDWNTLKKSIVKDISPWMTPESAGKRAELLLRHHGFAAYAATEARAMDDIIDIFTYRQYLSRQDYKVRPNHAALNGIILPSNHPFWRKHSGPWEWGCRCKSVGLMDHEVDEERKRDAKRAPEMRRVLEGPALKQLEKEKRLNRGPNNVIDVRTPKEKGGSYELDIYASMLPVKKLAERYTGPTKTSFLEWVDKIFTGAGLIKLLTSNES